MKKDGGPPSLSSPFLVSCLSSSILCLSVSSFFLPLGSFPYFSHTKFSSFRPVQSMKRERRAPLRKHAYPSSFLCLLSSSKISSPLHLKLGFAIDEETCKETSSQATKTKTRSNQQREKNDRRKTREAECGAK